MNWKEVVVLVLMGAVGLSCGKFSAAREDPPDFQAYIADLRRLGMTESAKGDLDTVASIRTGETLLTFSKDRITGTYRRNYQSTACAVPGADPELVKQRRSELQKQAESDVAILRTHADRDGSGFISTVEGQEFRDLVEFGYLAAHIVESEGSAVDTLVRAAHLPADQAVARVAQYNALARQLNESSEFKAPIVELTEPQVRATHSGPGAR